MGEWSQVKKCCCCIHLTVAIPTIGTTLLLLTSASFIAYLIKINDVWDFVLDDMYQIAPCKIPLIDTLIDTSFEYSIFANLLLLFALKKWTRWLLMPWLCVYFVQILLLIVISVLMFTFPLPLVPESHANYQLVRLFGLVPAFLAIVLFYCWIVVRSQFIKLGKLETDPIDSCCPLRIKTGVQILGSVLAILSGALLVLFFARLDELVRRQYFQLYQEELSKTTLTLMAGCIVLSIFVNILLILGGTGSKWRRSLVIPWLLFYGSGIIICLYTHLFFTSKCWAQHTTFWLQDKIIGMLCLGLCFIFLIFWTLVWIVGAQVTEKKKTMISVPSDVAFQRL